MVTPSSSRRIASRRRDFFHANTSDEITTPVATAIVQSAMAQTKPPVMLHDKAGREQCTMCHGGAMEGIKAMPVRGKQIGYTKEWVH